MMRLPPLLPLKHLPVKKALQGEAPLWFAWWMLGIPLVALAVLLGVMAEDYRYDEQHFMGALLDTVKLMVCLFWLIIAWRCSGNVRNRWWAHSGRIAIVFSIAFVGLIY